LLEVSNECTSSFSESSQENKKPQQTEAKKRQIRGPRMKGVKMGDNTVCKIEEIALKLLYKIWSTDPRYDVDKKQLKVATDDCTGH